MYAKNQILIVAGIFTSLFLWVGCSPNAAPIVDPPKSSLPDILPDPTVTSEAQMTNSAPHVSPYVKVIVTDVEVRFLETSPVQVELVIRGTLPDQCKYGFYSVENRTGQNIKVSLDGIHPADPSCEQTIQNIEYVLPLGKDVPEAQRGFAPGDYKLTVNNYQTGFSIQP